MHRRKAAALFAALCTLAAPDRMAQADTGWPFHPGLWPCGARWGADVILQGHVRLDNQGRNLPRPPDAPKSPFPRGGSYIMGGDAANLTVLPETVLRLTHFDVVCHALVIDGQPVTPARLPAGATLAEFEGSVGLLWPDDTAIILRGVTASLWQQGAGLQIHGTARDDSLSGTAGPDILLPGAGHDSVAPGAGDDAILYTSGTLTILDTPPNDGADHLELTRHDTRSLTFTADGADLLIGTPEGTIRIVNQLATPTGQLERLRLADSTGQIWIDAALMRDFAEGRSQP